jgi:RNA polymerase sigma-70 factor (ECF subfamily)
MRDVTLSDIERLAEAAEPVEVVFQMDEDTFRSFYDRTARSVWAYLSRATADTRLADDLLQEAYYRFLRVGGTYESDSHRRRYLLSATDGGTAARAAARIDLRRALARLKPRDRDLLWLAYAQGSSHEEIAASLGLKTASIKALLFRARRRLASLLGREYAAGAQGRVSSEDK